MVESQPESREKHLRDDPLLSKVPEVEGFKVLEPCVLYAKVGEGGMGAVYRGRHLNLDIDVAIKCLKNVLAEQSPSFVTRFQREARIAASVHHQNLVQVYDISEKNGVHYLVMEYVRGETARERVTRKRRLKESEALKIMLGAASGLAEAHGQRIVHRDIKPDNILISYDGKVKVSDLGLAKALVVDAAPSLTMGVMGTPQYMAPEQWEDSATVGPQADVWALGATFYYLMTGEPAIPGGSMQQIYRRICVDTFPSLREKLPSASPQACAILERCTQRDPKERFADCRELVRELSKFVVKDAPGPNLGDAESGTLHVPPLLSPPPAETLGHIRVALSDVGDKTMQVSTPVPGKPETRAAAGRLPSGVPPVTPLPTPAPAPRRRTPVALMLAAPIVVVAGLAATYALRVSRAGDDAPQEAPPEVPPPGEPGASTEVELATDVRPVAGIDSGEKPEVPKVEETKPAPTPEPLSTASFVFSVPAEREPLYTKETTTELRGFVVDRTSGEIALLGPEGSERKSTVVADGANGAFIFTIADLQEGEHSFRVQMEEAQSDAVTVICDRREPEIQTPGFQERINVRQLDLPVRIVEEHGPSVSAEVGSEIVDVRREGDDWVVPLDLDEGSNTIKILATDAAGNSTEKQLVLEVDTTAPRLKSWTPENEALFPGSNPIALHFDDPRVTVRLPQGDYSSDDDGWVRFAVDVTTNLPSYSLSGTVLDSLGNTAPLNAATWTVETKPRFPEGWSIDPDHTIADALQVGNDRWASRVEDPETNIWFRLVPSMGIYIAECEVTGAQFRKWPKSTVKDGLRENVPITNVGWKEADEYCKHYGYSLPTQDEWTAACLAGGMGPRPSGVDESNLPEFAWYDWPAKKDRPKAPAVPQPVKNRKPNALGIHDMLGNVWELCQEKTKLGGSFWTRAELCTTTSVQSAGGREGTPDTGFRPVKRIRN